MNHEFTMYVVDDAESARILLESAFAMAYHVESFETAEDCLAFLDQNPAQPDIFLLDVDLPGMDGYTLCRQIMARPELSDSQVIFISSLDDPESRIEGYDAGGMDYVVKPYNLAEVKLKVSAALRWKEKQSSLNEKAQDSEALTSLILANLDEYAALINFLRSLNACENPREMLDMLFRLMRAYRLHTAVQIRLPGHELTISEDGENRPLEMAVINHVRNLDRIFEFKTRSAYNFEYITVLVNDMPRHDPELCGRLRDHLAIAAECANARLQNLQTKAENTKAKATATDLIGALREVVATFERNYTHARYLGTSLTEAMLDELRVAFAALAMSEEQENQIEEFVRTQARNLAAVYDFGAETEAGLSKISEELASIANQTGTAELDLSPATTPPAAEAGNTSVQLF